MMFDILLMPEGVILCKVRYYLNIIMLLWWLRHCATSRKVAGLILDEVNDLYLVI
jgi:hypothetical protein